MLNAMPCHKGSEDAYEEGTRDDAVKRERRDKAGAETEGWTNDL